MTLELLISHGNPAARGMLASVVHLLLRGKLKYQQEARPLAAG